ncbi:MAG: NAD(P)/FAD-dependent oxidoreductase [Rhizobiaceae bacterium]
MARSTMLHPDFKPSPYWWEDVPEIEASAPLPRKVDVAIVGSGFCGLSAAIELARSGASVAVLDAGRIGEGASTRNGGMISAALKLPADLEKRVGADKADRLRREAVASLAHLEGKIAQENISCALQLSGRLVLAYSKRAHRSQIRMAEPLSRLTGTGVRALSKDDLRSEIDTDFYHGGMLIDHAGGLHPASLHRGLAEAAVRNGATLHNHFPVTKVERKAGGFSLSGAAGRLDADTLIMATNAYTGGVSPHFRRRLVPVASHMIATEEIAPDLMREISPKGRFFADTKRVLYYFRASPDGKRILFGGRGRFTACNEREIAQILHRAMCAVWPQLRTVRVTHAWQGNVSFTFDYLPHIARHEGVYFAGGCQGNGVAMSNYLGFRLGRSIARPEEEPSAFQTLGFPTMPFYSGNPWFLPLVGGYYRALDHVERHFF